MELGSCVFHSDFNAFKSLHDQSRADIKKTYTEESKSDGDTPCSEKSKPKPVPKRKYRLKKSDN